MTAAAIVLAAGQGTRMKSALPKVAHKILGRPLVGLVVDNARKADVDRLVVVIGHGAEVVRELLPGESFVIQEQQLGTGHAVMTGLAALGAVEGSLLVLSGDTPLIRPETIRRLVEAREAQGAAVALLTAHHPNPAGYGRIVRGEDGDVTSIVEEKDLTGDDLARIDEVNTGTYCFDGALLVEHISKLTTENAQGEYYLTDMIAHLRAEGGRVTALPAEDHNEILGANTRVQLAEAGKVMQRRLNEAHMLSGVTMMDPDLVWVGPDVVLGQDVTLEPMTFLLGTTVVEDGAVIGPSSRLVDCTVRRGATVRFSVLEGAEVGEQAAVGPMTYLRPGASLEESSKAGAFVEIKKSRIGKGSKVPHLSYVGDATIGEGSNLGAGTITCNYDGFGKYPTTIGNDVFIGSDTMLVAPVTVGDGAVTGAGSVISRDVPDDALAVERCDQQIHEGWAKRRRTSKHEE